MSSSSIREKLSKNHGYSMVELIFVMVLLVIFGITTFTLVISGSEAYKSIVIKKNTHTELRIAQSYVNMRIRQNDTAKGVSIEKNPVGTGNAIVIREVAQDGTYETWIYFDHGKLLEALVPAGKTVSNDASFVISEVDGFEVQYDKSKNTILVNIWRDEKGKKNNYGSLIHLKSTI